MNLFIPRHSSLLVSDVALCDAAKLALDELMNTLKIIGSLNFNIIIFFHTFPAFFFAYILWIKGIYKMVENGSLHY